MSRGLGEFFLLTLSRGVENWLGRECSRKRDVEGILTRANRANDKTLYSVTNEKCVFPFFVYSPRSCNDIFRFESESMYFFSRFELLARASRIERGKEMVGLKEIFCFSLFVSLFFSLFLDGERVKSREGFKVQEDNLNVFSGRLALIKNADREKVGEKIHSTRIPRVLQDDFARRKFRIANEKRDFFYL